MHELWCASSFDSRVIVFSHCSFGVRVACSNCTLQMKAVHVCSILCVGRGAHPSARFSSHLACSNLYPTSTLRDVIGLRVEGFGSVLGLLLLGAERTSDG